MYVHSNKGCTTSILMALVLMTWLWHFCMFAVGVVYIADILYSHSQNREQQAILELKALPIHVVNGTNTDVSSCWSWLLHSLHDAGIGYVSVFVTTDLRMYVALARIHRSPPLSCDLAVCYFALLNMYSLVHGLHSTLWGCISDTCYPLAYVLIPTYISIICMFQQIHHNKPVILYVVDYKFDWSSLAHCVLMWYVNTALQPV